MWLLRRQHPQHSLLGDLRDQDGADESVWPAALVLLPVSARRHPGELQHPMTCIMTRPPPFSFPPILNVKLSLCSLSLQPDVYPGNCWAFKGSQGYLVIRLSLRIRPTSFCLEHIPKALSPTGNITSAPRNFTVHVRHATKQTESTRRMMLFHQDNCCLALVPLRVSMMSTRRRESCWVTTLTKKTASRCRASTSR